MDINFFNSSISPIWSPSRLRSGGTLGAWYDAADSRTVIQSAGLVDQWNDKSGNGLHLTASTTARPTTGTRTINGKNTLDFDGTNDTMSNSGAFWNANFTGTDKPYEFYVMMEGDDAGLVGYPISLNTTTHFNPSIGMYRNPASNQTGTLRRNLAGTSQTGSTSVTTTEKSIFSQSFSGTDIVTRANGTTTLTTAYAALGDITIDRLHVGAYRGTGNFLDGKIAEILIFTAPLSQSDREYVEGYLAWKWGTVASLPYYHPYRWDGRIFGGYRLWQPSMITTSAWYDAADTNTITEAATLVSAWADKSGNGYTATQGTGALQPKSTTRTINNLNVIDFDGTDDIMTSGVGALVTGSDIAWDVYTVALTDTVAAGNRAIWSLGTVASNTSNHRLYLSVAAQASYRRAATGADSTVGLGLNATASVAQLQSLQFTGTTVTGRLNGTAGAGAPYAQNVDSLTIDIGIIGGARVSAAGISWWNGTIAEIIFIASNASQADRERLEGYLAHKWGTQASLPALHPYLTTPPRG